VIFQVPYWDVAQVWPRVAGCAQKALACQDEWREADILAQLAQQRMQLWVVPWSLAVVTQVQTYPGVRICMLVLAGGSGLQENKTQLREIERWAGSIGCDEMRIHGRQGWSAVYPDYERMATIMRKTL
jgi:hypothetical protein